MSNKVLSGKITVKWYLMELTQTSEADFNSVRLALLKRPLLCITDLCKPAPAAVPRCSINVLWEYENALFKNL